MKTPEGRVTPIPSVIVHSEEEEKEIEEQVAEGGSDTDSATEVSKSPRPPTPRVLTPEPISEVIEMKKPSLETPEESAIDSLIALANKEAPVLNGDIDKMKLTAEEEEEELPPSAISLDHCYSLPFTDDTDRQEVFNHDHGYTTMSPIERALTPPPLPTKSPVKPKKPKPPVIKRPPTPELPKITFKERDIMGEMRTLYEFLTQGIDLEDINYLKRSYEFMLQDDNQSYWLNDTHWVDHPDILFILTTNILVCKFYYILEVVKNIMNNVQHSSPFKIKFDYFF